MLSLQDKVRVVTGAARGIGRAIAKAFLAEGAQVLATDKDKASGRAMAEQIGCDFLGLDVTSEADLTALAAHAPAPHVVGNNAGVTGLEDDPVPHDAEYDSLEDWRAVHRVNLDGVFLGCRYAIGAMKARGSGSIINMSSRSGLVGISFGGGLRLQQGDRAQPHQDRGPVLRPGGVDDSLQLHPSIPPRS